MRKLLYGLGALALLSAPAMAAELGSNVHPLSFGKDQTIIDVSKVVWAPLNVEGLKKAQTWRFCVATSAKGMRRFCSDCHRAISFPITAIPQTRSTYGSAERLR